MLCLSGYFITEIGKENERERESGIEKWNHCCDKPDHIVQRPLGLLTGGMWKTLEVWVRKAIGCQKHSLTGHSHRSVECKNAKNNSYSGGMTHQVSKWNEDSIAD